MMDDVKSHWRAATRASGAWLSAALPSRARAVRQIMLESFETEPVQPLSGTVELIYPADRVVIRQVRLAQNAAARAREVIAPRIAEWSPWPVEQCLWTSALEDTADGFVLCDVAIASRETAAAASAELAARGAETVRVLVQVPRGDSYRVLLLSDDARPVARMARRVEQVALLAAAMLLFLALTVAMAAAMASYSARAIEASINAVAPGGQGQVTQGLAALFERKTAQQPVSGLLAHLAKNIPDGTWLTEAAVAEGSFTVTGKSTGLDGVIAAIEQDAAFSSVGFAAPTSKDAATGDLTFSISGRIEAAEGGQP